jgi:ATP-binding protein involved in chromosome partitioning
MTRMTKDEVLSELKRFAAPDGRGNIVSAGIVADVIIAGARVTAVLNADPKHMNSMNQLQKVVEEAIRKLPGVDKAVVVLTAEKQQTQAPVQPRAGRALAVDGVKYLLAVASGKGGVGKSTTAINLALGLKANGHRVAVIDADIYGPSMPRLFGLTGRPEAADAEGKKMKPMQRFGVEVASIGFLVDEETAMIWRGPMVMSAITQLIRDVQWSPADVMVFDLPPGTGDAQLTLAQQTALSGAVIVSTPQDLALIDARKAINMFGKVNVPILGLIENMSYFTCTKCGERHDIFGHGGAEAEALRKNIPFLGAVPLDLELRERSDSGEPIVVARPEAEHSKIYRRIAEQVWNSLEAQNQSSGPSIVYEDG